MALKLYCEELSHTDPKVLKDFTQVARLSVKHNLDTHSAQNIQFQQLSNPRPNSKGVCTVCSGQLDDHEYLLSAYTLHVYFSAVRVTWMFPVFVWEGSILLL